MSCGYLYLLGHSSLCAEERAAFLFMVFFFTFTAEHKLENKPKQRNGKNTLGMQTADYNREESCSRRSLGLLIPLNSHNPPNCASHDTIWSLTWQFCSYYHTLLRWNKINAIIKNEILLHWQFRDKIILATSQCISAVTKSIQEGWWLKQAALLYSVC